MTAACTGIYPRHGDLKFVVRLSVCSTPISSETAKRIWLKFCIETYVPDTASHILVAIALEYPRGEPKIWFLPRDAMHKRGICCRAVSVCLSVFLSVYHIRVFCRND